MRIFLAAAVVVTTCIPVFGASKDVQTNVTGYTWAWRNCITAAFNDQHANAAGRKTAAIKAVNDCRDREDALVSYWLSADHGLSEVPLRKAVEDGMAPFFKQLSGN